MTSGSSLFILMVFVTVILLSQGLKVHVSVCRLTRVLLSPSVTAALTQPLLCARSPMVKVWNVCSRRIAR